jgi:replicative DNA helicase
MQRIEQTILSNLLYSEEYLRKVYPFLKAEYFPDKVDNKLFKTISSFIDDYNTNPTKEAIEITLQNENGIDEDLYDGCTEQLEELEPSETEFQWIVDESEKFCKSQAIYNAITRSISIQEGKDKELQPNAIPSILQDALSVAFNTEIGHSYFGDAANRHDAYNRSDVRVPFKLDMLNRITYGGVTKKSLSCFLCPTGGGKTVFMSDWAAFLVSIGYDVLYITGEMADIKIAERVDANLLDVPINEVKHIKKSVFVDRVGAIQSKVKGELVVKEFPTASAHVGHIKTVLNELRIKKNFVPKIVFIDYINIFLSQRYKPGNNANTNTIIKAISEEFRGMAVEYDLPVVTATQVTRSGLTNTDLEMGDTSESIGLTSVLDFYMAMIPSDELDEMNQIMFKQLKNRWGDINYYKRFVVGKDFSKMKLYDVDNNVANTQRSEKEKETIQQAEKYNDISGTKSSSKLAGKNFDGINFN